MGRAMSAPWSDWYTGSRWRKCVRPRILRRDLFTCRQCGRIEGDTSLLVVDHIKPHRGDANLFWAEANMQVLCKSCHDRAKREEERATLHTRGVWW
jgi:5-methylcytosine-specific restriction endonuclease McrA